MRDFLYYHLSEALQAAAAEANGDEALARRLRAQTKLRLINMLDEELWELAKLTSSPPERPAELVYEKVKEAAEKLRASVGEWAKDLTQEAASSTDREE